MTVEDIGMLLFVEEVMHAFHLDAHKQCAHCHSPHIPPTRGISLPGTPWFPSWSLVALFFKQSENRQQDPEIPKSASFFLEKSACNCDWIDSSIQISEQIVRHAMEHQIKPKPFH